MTALISDSDARIVNELAASVRDSTPGRSIPQGRRELLRRLTQVIPTDAWIWVTGSMNVNVVGDAMAVSMIDEGWEPHEQAAIVQMMTSPEYTAILFEKLHADLLARQAHTMSRDQFMDNEAWRASRMGQQWQAAGFDHFLISAYPVGSHGYSAVGLHRRLGQEAFTARDRALLHVLWQQVDWLHREEGNGSPSDKVLALSPQERQVMLLLIAGDTAEQVAEKLQWSEELIAGNLAGIYGKLGVTDRDAMLAQFMAGAG